MRVLGDRVAMWVAMASGSRLATAIVLHNFQISDPVRES
jgi:hypothetical protein